MKIFLSAITLFVATFCLAQVPQGISYQAIAFNSNGAPLTNGNVGVKISILDNSTSGTVLYSETHTKPTNAQGLFNLNIGEGSATIGSFPAISWGTNSKFLKVELDPAGGTNYTVVGTNQLMSVPYALYAGTATTVVSGGGGGGIAESGNFLIYNEDQASAWNAQTGAWTSITTSSSTRIDSAAGSDGNFIIYNENQAIAWNKSTSSWTSTTTSSSTRIDSIVGSGGNFVAYNENQAVAWSSTSSAWTSTTTSSSTGIDGAVRSKGNFMIYNENQASAWNSQTNQWTSVTTTSSTRIDGAAGSNGNFIVFNENQAIAWSKTTSTWTSTTTSSSTRIDVTINGDE